MDTEGEMKERNGNPALEVRPVMAKKLPPGNAVQVLHLEDPPRASNRTARVLRLNTQVLRDIVSKTENLPIAVIAIAGPPGKGKSFMLSYIVRYLQALEKCGNGDAGDWMDKSNPNKAMTSKGFTFRNGMDRTTEGIWMWTRPFIIKKSESEPPIAVLVMDTEGCFDPYYSNEQEQSSILGLSLLLSSCFIYNDSGLISESTIATLAKFMEYGQIGSDSFERKGFQRLMFLIRDWSTPGFEHGAAGGQGLIHKCFAPNPRMSHQAKVNRKLIQDHFEDCNAYLLPFPGEKVASEDFTGSIGEMREEFRSHVEKFVSHLIADLAPKKFGNEPAVANTFLKQFFHFVDAFNEEDKMPTPSSIHSVMIYSAYDSQIRKLIQAYDSEFQKKLFTENNLSGQREFVAAMERMMIQKVSEFIQGLVMTSTKIWAESKFELQPTLSKREDGAVPEIMIASEDVPKESVKAQAEEPRAKVLDLKPQSREALQQKRIAAAIKTSSILETFVASHLERTDPEVSQRVKYYRKKLEEEMDSLFALQVTNLEDLEQELQEQNNHSSGASTAMSSAEPQCSQEGPTESAVAGSLHTVNVNISNSKKSDLVPTQGHKSSRPPGIWPLPKLPPCELAIHFGLHRTLAGIVAPGTENVAILYDLDNCLYFDHPDLLLDSEDAKSQKYKPSRIPNILKTPPDLPHEVTIENTRRFMRLEELIACLFSALKWKTELDRMVEISNGVICIPQSLNETQRKTIHDAARIAGFRKITLIDDTSALALAFMLRCTIVKSSVIVANTSEGFIDAGYFNFVNGIVYRVGVSGEYFNKEKDDRNTDYSFLNFLGHLGAEYKEFEENILQIFKGYVNANGSPIPGRQSQLRSIILSGNRSQIVQEIWRVLNLDDLLNYRMVEHVGEDYRTALFGAAYLTVLNDFKPEHPIFKRWVSLIKMEASEELQKFRRYLLEHRPVQGVLTMTNPPTRANLSEEDFASLKDTFYLNKRKQLHEMKMRILKKVLYLESSVKSLSHLDEYEKQDIIAQIGTIRIDVQSSELPVEQLCVYDFNLNDWLDEVSP